MSMDKVNAQLDKNEREGIERLMDWLRIPSVGADPAYRDDTRRAAEWVAERLRELGISVEIIETGTKERPGNPMVWARHEGKPDAPHVLFYGHYDVQPADPLDLWESPPFEPAIRKATPNGPGERVVARGAVDDKGQVSTFLEALRGWKEGAGEIPANLTIMIEGEEESGSVSLEGFMNQKMDALKSCDVCVISDSNQLGRNKPAITYGVRGLAYTEVFLHAADQDLHSGIWGGRVPNPINELAKILAQLWDDKRRVTLAGFYNGVGEVPEEQRKAWRNLGISTEEALEGIGLSPEGDVGEEGFTSIEREWARPTCDINGVAGGYQGAGAKTVIPSYASAKVSFRLVDDQDPKAVTETFFKFLRDRTPPGCRWELRDYGGGPPATAPLDSPYLKAAKRAVGAAADKEPAMIKSGGSIPVVGMLKQMAGLDTILMGFGLEDDRVHSPNEKFELDCWRLGVRSHARLIDEWSRWQG